MSFNVHRVFSMLSPVLKNTYSPNSVITYLSGILVGCGTIFLLRYNHCAFEIWKLFWLKVRIKPYMGKDQAIHEKTFSKSFWGLVRTAEWKLVALIFTSAMSWLALVIIRKVARKKISLLTFQQPVSMTTLWSHFWGNACYFWEWVSIFIGVTLYVLIYML